jgi:hypothetical protein
VRNTLNLPYGELQMDIFDFNKLSIDRDHANRLNRIQAAEAGNRNKLWKFIKAIEFVKERGVYIPLSEDVRLLNRIQSEFGRVPTAPFGKLQESFPYRFFGNALLLRDGAAADASPSQRLTNCGFIVVTHEFDPKNVEQFDEIGAWFAGDGNNETRFHQVHNALKVYTDYRGYSVVYSGRQSYHMHFIFDTTRLGNAPYDELASERLWNYEAKAALMTRVYKIAWAATKAALLELNPPTDCDPHMESPIQWRRSPFAIRQIEAGKAIFGFQEGESVPQLVVREDISSRAYPYSGLAERKPLIDPAISLSHLFAKAKSVNRASNGAAPPATLSNYDEVLAAIREACALEWGDYPRLERIGFISDGYALYFANHAGDMNPSTVVKGNFRQLYIQPLGFFSDQNFFLPDNFTANAIVAHWSRVTTGLRDAEISFGNEAPKPEIIQAARNSHRELFAEDLNGLLQAPDFRTIFKNALLINGMPGSGKSSCILDLLKDRFEGRVPWEDSRLKIILFCSVSTEQAQKKLEEYQQYSGGEGIIWEGFWKIYASLCHDHQVATLSNSMENHQPHHVWDTIASHQPGIAKALTEYREAMWRGIDLNKPIVIFTTVATVTQWPYGRVAKALWHPEFVNDMDADEIDALADGYDEQVCILDDYRWSDLLYQFNELQTEQVRTINEEFPNWGTLSRRLKLAAFENRSSKLQSLDFETLTEYAYIDIDELYEVKADFGAIPYSFDPKEAGMYQRMSGKSATFVQKPWFNVVRCPKVFLTTESVVVATTQSVIGADNLFLREIEPAAGIHPVSIPIVCDDRAVKRKANALVDEILASNENTVVIRNGEERKLGNKVINFERVKGRNDLKEKDIYIIMTMLHAEEYFKLNTLGIFIGRNDIIQMHYRDLLTQATGRNTGYRDTGDGRQAVVIQCTKLQRAGYFDEAALNSDDPNTIREFITYRGPEKLWLWNEGAKELACIMQRFDGRGAKTASL